MANLNELPRLPKLLCTIGNLPASYVMSLSYEEQLFKLYDYLNKNLVPATKELQELYEVLSKYFDNLDVQEEINNKLDEMEQSGELAEIINEQIFNELNTNLENLQTDFAKTKYPASYYKDKNMVVFGDSFSQPQIANSEDEYWVKRVATATGMTRFNFAVAGAGFGRTNNTLYSQLETALANMTETERNNTSVVIVYAGYNDIMNSVDNDLIINNCITLVSEINENFPNAKIILAPFNWSYGSLSQENNITIETLINRMARETSSYPVVMLKQARYWLLGVVSYFRNSAHPSVSGYKVIASYMLNAIFGNSEEVCIGGHLTPSHGSQNICNFSFENGLVNFRFAVKFGEDLEDYAGEQFADLHALLTPEIDMIIPLYAIDGYKGTLRLANNGKGYLRNLTVSADTWIFANVTFQPQAWKAYPTV